MYMCHHFRFTGMGIIHTARKHIKDELVRKMRMQLLEERKRANINATISVREDAQVNLNLDLVCHSKFRLCNWIEFAVIFND